MKVMRMPEERNDENSSKPSTEAIEHKSNKKTARKQVSSEGNEATKLKGNAKSTNGDEKSSKAVRNERFSLKKSQGEEIDGEESGKKKLSRLSLIASPKAAVKSKFKECSQQSNLNSFLKVKSPKNAIDGEADVEGATLKVSSNLFGTPKRDKIKNKSEGKRIKRKKNLQLATIENLNETIVNEHESNNIETKSEIAVYESLKPDVAINKISSTIQNMSNEVDSNLTFDKNLENSKTENNSLNLNDSENNSKLPDNNLLTLENSGKLNIQSDSETKITVSSESNSLIKPNVLNNKTSSENNSLNQSEITDENLTSPKNNVFEFMMHQRHKSIGSNSPGKTLESPPVVDETTSKDAREKLQTRKLKFERWNENKGASQRKVDDEEKGVYISKVLTKRKKRLKKMLTTQSDSEDEAKQTKRKRRGRSESEDSSEARPLKKKKLQAPILLDEAADDEETFKKHNKLAATQKVQTGLLNFFGVLKRETHETVSDDECKENKTIKIKMFTPQAMKKREKRKRSRKLSSTDESTRSTELKEVDNNSESSENIKLSVLKSKVSEKLSNEVQTINLTDDEASSGSFRRSSRRRKVINVIEDSEDFEDKEKESGKKVAPVFLKSLPKPKLDPAVAQARFEFLHSGVPSLLKRVVEKQQQSFEEIEFDVFPVISHVQQRPNRLALYWDLDPPELEVGPYPLYEPEELPPLSLGSLTNIKDEVVEEIVLKPPAGESCLEEIKRDNSELPVYKIYRLLLERTPKLEPERPKLEKKRRGRKKKEAEKPPEKVEDGAMWPEKYKPKLPEEVIGNRKCIKRFTAWLQNWVDYSKEKANKKPKRSENSDSDFESTDGDSRDTRLPNNMMILSGPLGCGKSAAVYSVCYEMNINVIELNASSKRTGKKLLQEVQEATQSHQVRNKNIGPFFQKFDETRGSNKMCLLVIEDIDIVFEQDEGFIYALNQLLSTSKRPVALLTSDLNCPHVQKFVLHNNSLRFDAISPGTSSVWLQILCAAEGLRVDRSSIAQLLHCNKGDLRRTLLQLQFWVQTGGNPRGYNTNYTTPSIKLTDFAYQEDEPKIQETSGNSDIHYFRLQERNKLSLGALWWNLPDMLGVNSENLERLSGVLETIAACDSLIKNEPNDLEPCYKRWETELTNGLSLSENMQSYKDCSLLDSLTQTLLQGHCKLYKTDCYNNVTPAVPSSDIQSRRNEHFNCEAVYSEAVPLNYSTDRKAFAADYFPALRGISRTETVRAKNNNKRGNRFYNYLKTLNFTPSSSIIKTACDILSVQNI